MASVLLPHELQNQMTKIQQELWSKFESAQKDFHQQLSAANKYAFDLEKQLEDNLKNIVVEGLSVPARGAANAIQEMGKLSRFLGEGLSYITEAAKVISTSGQYVAKGHRHAAEIGSFLTTHVDPVIQKAGNGLISLANNMDSFADNYLKEYPLVKRSTQLFSGTFKAIGYSLKGLSGLINAMMKLDSKFIAPGLELLANGIHRIVNVLHSTTESIREVTQGIHVRCENIAKNINIKPDSEANKKLDALVSKTAKKASDFLWASLHGSEKPKEKETEEVQKRPKLTGRKGSK
jgi:hypothetical protein